MQWRDWPPKTRSSPCVLPDHAEFDGCTRQRGGWDLNPRPVDSPSLMVLPIHILGHNQNHFLDVSLYSSKQIIEICESIISSFTYRHGKVKTKLVHSGYKRRVPELIPVLGSQPAGDWSYKLGGRLPLLTARPRLPPQPPSITAHWPVPTYTAWWQRQMSVNNYLSRVIHSAARRPRFKPATCWSQVQHPNYHARTWYTFSNVVLWFYWLFLVLMHFFLFYVYVLFYVSTYI